MAFSTEEIALVILVALQAEQNRPPTDVRGRRPLGVLTRQLMDRHDWQELDFLQGWGLITSEKLAEVQQHGGAYYPCLTDAGRTFIDRQQDTIYKAANRAPLFDDRQWLFIIALVMLVVRLAVVLWKSR
jgi:hypothetical protein